AGRRRGRSKSRRGSPRGSRRVFAAPTAYGLEGRWLLRNVFASQGSYPHQKFPCYGLESPALSGHCFLVPITSTVLSRPRIMMISSGTTTGAGGGGGGGGGATTLGGLGRMATRGVSCLGLFARMPV